MRKIPSLASCALGYFSFPHGCDEMWRHLNCLYLIWKVSFFIFVNFWLFQTLWFLFPMGIIQQNWLYSIFCCEKYMLVMCCEIKLVWLQGKIFVLLFIAYYTNPKMNSLLLIILWHMQPYATPECIYFSSHLPLNWMDYWLLIWKENQLFHWWGTSLRRFI